jgi:hypothetical protein
VALVPGGAVTKGSIADLKGVLTYTFEVKGTAGMKKVMVDAKTGAATLAVTKPAGKPGAKPKTGGTKPGGG